MIELQGQELIDLLVACAKKMNEHSISPRWAYFSDGWAHRPEGDKRPRKRRINGRLLPMRIRAGSNAQKRRTAWRVYGRGPFAE